MAERAQGLQNRPINKEGHNRKYFRSEANKDEEEVEPSLRKRAKKMKYNQDHRVWVCSVKMKNKMKVRGR